MRRSTKRFSRGLVITKVVVGSEGSSGSQRINFLMEIVPIARLDVCKVDNVSV